MAIGVYGDSGGCVLMVRGYLERVNMIKDIFLGVCFVYFAIKTVDYLGELTGCRWIKK